MTAKASRPISIPEPTPDVQGLFNSVSRLKEGYENLSRQRGEPSRWSVTFQDLIDMGVITQEKMNEQLQRRRF